jgi:UDP-3-O-[3-hydroxymyristoyl] N-acetylglucosamine deacetylase
MNNQTIHNQTTLRAPVSLSGIGLHSGSTVTLNVRPAAANTGITFRRMDVIPAHSMIPARFDAVCETRLGTTIKNTHGVTVATIEHLMAALWGAGVDNALVELDAPEVPIMDGSSEPFSLALEKVGLATLATPKKILRVIKTVEVREGESTMRIEPNRTGEEGLVLSIAVDYDNAVIGRQAALYDFREQTFKQTLARARTFGFEYEVEAMRDAGLALGGSLDNAIVVGEGRILNADGLRFADEFVRHKALDVVGDMFLAGYMLDAHITCYKPGHGINNKLLRALMADDLACSIELASLHPALQPTVTASVFNS